MQSRQLKSMEIEQLWMNLFVPRILLIIVGKWIILWIYGVRVQMAI